MEKQPKTLDEWYRLINSIYLDRNFFRSHESIFTHLIEVCGGLSPTVSYKTQKNGDIYLHLSKAIGWWLSLCGHIGVKSVEKMIWRKFPYVCPYCKMAPHKPSLCKEINPKKIEIVWTDLEKIANGKEGEQPKRIDEFKLMFNEIYLDDGIIDIRIIFSKLEEELGELAEAIRLIPISHAYFMNEAVDVFAWLMRYANYVEMERKSQNLHFELLQDALWNEYPNKCRFCGEEACKCSAILFENLGRISREMPIGAFKDAEKLGVFSYDEKIEIFKLSGKVIKIGEKQIPLNKDLLQEMYNLTNELMLKLSNIEKVPQNLDAALEQLNKLSSQQNVTQKSIDELMEAFEKSPQDIKNILINFLTNLGSGGILELLLFVFKTLSIQQLP